jgi:proline iminopeptidase
MNTLEECSILIIFCGYRRHHLDSRDRNPCQPAIYSEMQGKSEFVVNGNFKDRESRYRLHEITVRTPTSGAARRTMDREDLKKMAGMVVDGEYLHRPKWSHLAMWHDHAANYGAY